MLKLIVSDFDGTLLPYGQTCLSEKLKIQIKKAAEQGISIAVSSGRTYLELLPYFDGFTDMLWFICCDGAYYVKNGKIFYEKQIEKTELEAFFKKAGSGFSFVLHGAMKNYAVGDIPTEAMAFSPEIIKKPGDIKEKIFKITSYGERVKLTEYSSLRTHWDGGENATAQYVNRFCDKGAALSDLQVRLMLTRFDSACLGDGGNDIAMMKNAKYSVCIGERQSELSDICTHCFATAEEAFDFLLEV